MRILQPGSVEEAVQALAEGKGEAKIVAGGTALVLMMQQRLIAPDALVSLGRLPGFDAIRSKGERISIGAGATLHGVATDRAIGRRYPSLAYACSRVGNVRIRNAATLGGNLAEADYASDPPAVLVALDAIVRIADRDGGRESTVEDLLVGYYSTTLEPTEVITEILLPPRDPTRDRDVYVKYISRSSEDRPCVGIAASARFADGSAAVEGLRIAVGAAVGTPERFPEIEAIALGGSLDEATINRVADGYAESIEPLDDLRGTAWYRRQMVRTFTREALRVLATAPGEAA